MKKWVSMLLTVMMLVNSVFSPIIALAEEADTFPTGYAYAAQDVRIFDNIDTDGDGKTELAQIGTILAGGYLYVSYVESNGAWADVAFPVGGEVIRAHAQTKELTHVAADGGEPSGLSFNGHALSVVVYQEKHYDIPKTTEEPTEEPTAVPTEEPTEEPTAVPTEEPTEEPTAVPTEEPTEEPTAVPTEEPTEEPTAVPTEEPTEEPTAVPTEEPTEEPTAVPTEEPEVDEPEATEEPEANEPEATEEPEVDEPEATEEPEADEPEATEEPEADEPEATEEPEVDEPEATEEPEVDETEATEEPEVDETETTEEPEVDETEATEEPEVDETEATEEPEVDEPEVTEEPEIDEPEATEEPEVDETETTEESVIEEPETEEQEEPTEVQDEEAEEAVEEVVEEGPLTLTATHGSSVITVSGEAGAIPTGAVLQVEPVANALEVLRMVESALPDDMVVASLTAYDITLLVDGEVVQPNENVKVSISDAVSGISLFSIVSFDGVIDAEESETFVFHVSEGGAELISTMEGANQRIVITVPHFSVYAKVVAKKQNEKLPDVIDGPYEAKNARQKTVTWEEPKRDPETGEIIYKKDENGNDIYVYDENGNPVMEDVLDANGMPVLIYIEDQNYYNNNGYRNDPAKCAAEGVVYTQGQTPWGYYEAWFRKEQTQKREAETETKTEVIDITSPAFDFHAFGETVSIGSGDFNGNFAGNTVNGGATWGTKQHQGEEYGDVSYVGESANNLNKGSSSGTLVVGSDVDVEERNNGNNAAVGQNGTSQDEMTVYKVHKHTDACFDGDKVICGMQESTEEYINITEELNRLKTVSENIAGLSDYVGLSKELAVPAQNAFVEIEDDGSSDVIVRNLKAINFIGQYTFNFPKTNALVVINVDMTGVADGTTFDWSANFGGNQKNGEESAYDNNNILWNFYVRDDQGQKHAWTGSANLFTSSGFTGTVLAPAGTIEFDKLNGSVIANHANHSGGESHFSPFTGGSTTVTVNKQYLNAGSESETFFFAVFKEENGKLVKASETRRLTVTGGVTGSLEIPVNNYDPDATYWIYETDNGGNILYSDAGLPYTIDGNGVAPGGTIVNTKKGDEYVDPTTTFTPSVEKSVTILQKSQNGNVNGTRFNFTVVGVDPQGKSVFTKNNNASNLNGWYDYNGAESGSGFAQFNDDPFLLKEEGTYTFTITEANNGASGWTYDGRTWTVKVVVGKDGDVLKVTSVSYSTDDVSDADHATFKNDYAHEEESNPEPSSAAKKPSVVKRVNSSAATQQDRKFLFTVQLTSSTADDGVQPTWMQGTVYSVDYNSLTGTAQFDQEFTFSQSGTYTFSISEEQHNGNGWTYDNDPWTMTVVVKDGDNGLYIESTTYSRGSESNSSAATFSNTYEPEDEGKPEYGKTTFTPVIVKETVINGNESYRQFVFSVKALDTANVEPSEITGYVYSYVKNGSTNAQFNNGGFTFSEPGTYTFEIREQIESGADANWHYDTDVWKVEVVVEAKGTQLEVTSKTYSKTGVSDASEATFVNRYGDEPEDPTPSEPEGFSPRVNKTVIGADSTDKTFKFAITAYTENGFAVDWNKSYTNPDWYTLPGTLEIPGSGSASFGQIKFTSDATGTFFFAITEIADDDQSWDYDGVKWVVQIDVNQGKITPGTLKYWTSNVPDWSRGTYQENTSEASFYNKYDETEKKPEPVPTDATLPVQKTIEGGAFVQGKTFTFDIQEDTSAGRGWVPHDGVRITGNNVQVNGNNELVGQTSGTASLSVKFLEPGSYDFDIWEQIEESTGWTYDKIHWYAHAEVTMNDDGTLNVEWTYTHNGKDATGETITFKNIYKPESTAATIPVKKTITGDFPEDATASFKFELVEYSGEYERVLQEITAETAAEGAKEIFASFEEITYTEAGTYTYRVREVKGDDSRFTYSETVYEIVVEVEDLNGYLRATAKYNDASIGRDTLNFRNHYQAEKTSLTPGVEKTVSTNSIAKAQSFEFTLELQSANPQDGFTALTDEAKRATVAYPAQESASFGEIEFTRAGVYEFIIRETPVDVKGWNDDDAVWTVTITVTDEDGKLEATPVYAKNGEAVPGAEAAQFVNTYTVTGTSEQLGVTKTVNGPVPEGEDKTFSFELSADAQDGMTLPENRTVTVTGNGSETFDEIQFTKAGTYTFTIKETNSGEPGYGYDAAEWTVTVTVEDVDSELKVTDVTYEAKGKTTNHDAAAFVNTYTVTGEPEYQPKVDKTITGDEPETDRTFNFRMSADPQEGMILPEDLTATVNGVGEGVFKAVRFTKPGTYTIRIQEVAGSITSYDYDETVWTLTVTVADVDSVLKVTGETYTATVKGQEKENTTAAEFENEYDAGSADVDLNLAKSYTGEIPASAEGAEFTFEVTVVPADGVTVGEAKIAYPAKEATFHAEFTKAGTYTFTVKENETELANWSTDTAEHTVTVTVGYDENDELTVTDIVYDDGDAVAYENAYDAGKAETDLELTKSYEGEIPAGADAEFTFTATVQPSDGVTVGKGTIKYPEKTAQIHAEFTRPDVYTFTIVEDTATAANWTADTASRQVIVTVGYGDNGKLTVTNTEYVDGGSAAAFVNTYDAGTPGTTMQIVKSYEGEIPESEKNNARFTFNVTVDKQDGVEAMDEEVTITYPATGASFGATFSKAGTYTFTIVESEEAGANWSTDSAVRTVTVVVDFDDEDQLVVKSVTYADDAEGAAFINTYDAGEAEATLDIAKSYEGEIPETAEGTEFTFDVEVSPSEGVTVDEAKIAYPEKDATFGMTFTKAGTYTVTIKENQTDAAHWTTDGTVRRATVVVDFDDDGKLTVTDISYEDDAEAAAFTNEYDAGSDDAELKIAKSYEGEIPDSANGTEFTFTATVSPSEGVTVTNATIVYPNDSGAIKATFTKAGTYVFTIEEAAKPGTHWTTDTAKRVVTVVVGYDNDGQIEVQSVTYADGADAVAFKNAYDAGSDQAELEIQKNYKGAIPEGASATFTFDVTVDKTDGVEFPSIVTIDYPGNSKVFDATFTKAGTYTFTIRESAASAAHWSIDGDAYTVTVVVGYDEDGQIDVQRVTYANNADAAVFTNTYDAGKAEKDLNLSKRYVGSIPAGITPTFTFNVTVEPSEGATIGNAAITYPNEDTTIHTEFTLPGTYTFTITENETSEANWTADAKSHQVIVTVGFDENGQLTVTDTQYVDGGDAVTYENTYDAGSDVAELKIAKAYEGEIPEGTRAEFTFDVTVDQADGVEFASPVSIDYPGDSKVFGATFTKAGVYTFTITENETEAAHWTTDGAVRTVVVTVGHDEAGKLHVDSVVYDNDANETAAAFTNAYDAGSDDAALKIAKSYEGEIPDSENGTEFTFTATVSPSEGVTITNEKIAYPGETGEIGATFTKAGTYVFTIEEATKPGTHWTTDTVKRVVTVVVGYDNDGHIEVQSVTYADDAEAAAFTNAYDAGTTDVDLNIEKRYEGEIPDGIAPEFTFTATVSPSEGVTITDGKITYPSEAGAIHAEFTKAGEYTFAVSENPTSEPNWTADTATHQVIVTVGFDGDGQLTVANVEYVDGGNAAAFKNTYDAGTAGTKLNIVKSYEGEIPENAEAEFTFSVAVTPAEGVETVDSATISYPETGAVFGATFTKAGTYEFTITEGETDAANWTTDSAIRKVTVVVGFDENGKLAVQSVTYADDAEAAAFKNAYDAGTVETTLNIAKAYEGEIPEDAEAAFTFSVSVTPTEGVETVDSATVSYPDEGVTFGATFTKAGTYTFTIMENAADAAHWATDDATRTVTVTVGYGDDGKLHLDSVVYDGDGEAAAFTNTYDAGIAATTLNIAKAYEGEIPADTEATFTFDVTVEPAEGVETADSATIAYPATGAAFGATFTKAGTYTFTITENDADAANWAKDDAIRTATVVVGFDDDGQLTVKSVTYADDAKAAAFTNTYDAGTADTTLNIAKAYEGEIPEDNDAAFTFKVTVTPEEGVETVNSATVKYPDEGTTFGATFTKAGTYTFTITEDATDAANWSTDETVRTVVVTVGFDEAGKLAVQSVSYGEDATAAAFKNAYDAGEANAVLNLAKRYVGDIPADADAEFTFDITVEPSEGVTVGEAKIAYPNEETTIAAAFTKAGDYTFTIRENETELAGWTTDAAIRTVVVTVGFDESGKLTVTDVKYEGESSAAEFENIYETTPTPIALNIKKTVSGIVDPENPEIPDFTFVLSANGEYGDAVEVAAPMTVTVTASDFTGNTANAAFGGITFTKAGTYAFTVKEDAPAYSPLPNVGMWIYDLAERELTVEVADNDSQLEIVSVKLMLNGQEQTVALTGDPAVVTVEFENEFVPAVPVVIPTPEPTPEESEEPTPEVTESTEAPTEEPTPEVTESTEAPTEEPTPEVTESTEAPTEEPTPEVTESTEAPTEEPTPEVTESTEAPTEEPTPEVTESTEAPTEEPTPEVTVTPVPVIPVTNLSGTKTWVDNDDADGMRPEDIEIVLYANGVAQNRVPNWVKNGNVWTYTFTNLPVTTLAGIPIAYTVTETPVEYYTSAQDGLNFTNTIVPKQEVSTVEVSGRKTWMDNDNAGNTRPASITIELQQNGVTIRSAVVTADDNWAYTFTDLPEGDGYGNAYTYSVREQAVNGYYAVYDGMNVTNVLIPVNTVPQGNFTTINDLPVARGLPIFGMYNEGELADMFELFDYGVPLFGVLLGTGLEIPMYPFVFAGFGALAIVLLIAFGRKKKED